MELQMCDGAYPAQSHSRQLTTFLMATERQHRRESTADSKSARSIGIELLHQQLNLTPNAAPYFGLAQ
jgi:hypothetical protein